MQSVFIWTVAPKTHQAEIRTMFLPGDLPMGKAAFAAGCWELFSPTALRTSNRLGRGVSRLDVRISGYVGASGEIGLTVTVTRVDLGNYGCKT
jgi:hypothetical protein